MIVDFNIRRERFYALIVILCYVTTNIILYFEDPSSIIEDKTEKEFISVFDELA